MNTDSSVTAVLEPRAATNLFFQTMLQPPGFDVFRMLRRRKTGTTISISVAVL